VKIILKVGPTSAIEINPQGVVIQGLTIKNSARVQYELQATLTKIMAGVTEATDGTMLLDAQPVSFRSPAEALQHGVTMVFQETSLVPSMTVAQNLYLGDEKFFNRLRGIYIAAQTFLNSMNFSVEECSESVWSTNPCFAKGEMIKVGTRKPSPYASTCGGGT